MASLKEIKDRINSVNGTLKITSAMKMVASSKLRKAQNAIGNLLPYEKQMHKILADLLSGSVSATGEVYTERRKLKKVAIVAFASNSSLCGAFNSNAIRHFKETADRYINAGLSKDDILVYPVGKKMAEGVAKAGFKPQGDFNTLADRHAYNEAASFAESLIDSYLKGETDRIELVYNHYKSSASQIPMNETYLPFAIETDGQTGKEDADGNDFLKNYIIEPDPQSVLRVLLPKVLVLKIFTVLLDANAAEHAARTVAMQEASDNAQKLLQELKVQYNKQRQQAITNELLDIVSGTMVNN